MQSLCTLRAHCRQWPRNTRYQAGAAPYLGRTSTGWIAPACLAHSFDHLVGAGKERERHFDAKSGRRLEVNGSPATMTAPAPTFESAPKAVSSSCSERAFRNRSSTPSASAASRAPLPSSSDDWVDGLSK